MAEERERAAVQLRHRHDVVAGLGDVDDRVGDGGLARRRRQGGHPALQGREALLEDVLRRVHDPRVDVARHRQVEQVRAVLGVVELVGDRLVDRHGHGLGGGVGLVAGVQGDRFVSH